MYPTVPFDAYTAERQRQPGIRNRAVTTEQAEERGLFLAREGATLGAFSPAWHEVVEQLIKSKNNAIATEALRLAILAEART